MTAELIHRLHFAFSTLERTDGLKNTRMGHRRKLPRQDSMTSNAATAQIR
jgi:hypothetical protein